MLICPSFGSTFISSMPVLLHCYTSLIDVSVELQYVEQPVSYAC